MTQSIHLITTKFGIENNNLCITLPLDRNENFKWSWMNGNRLISQSVNTSWYKTYYSEWIENLHRENCIGENKMLAHRIWTLHLFFCTDGINSMSWSDYGAPIFFCLMDCVCMCVRVVIVFFLKLNLLPSLIFLIIH